VQQGDISSYVEKLYTIEIPVSFVFLSQFFSQKRKRLLLNDVPFPQKDVYQI